MRPHSHAAAGRLHTPDLFALPSVSWTEDESIQTADRTRKLRRWGSVQAACKILDDCDRETIYDLIAVGAIDAYKRRPHRANSHWRVDLLSVWAHKQRQMQRHRRA